MTRKIAEIKNDLKVKSDELKALDSKSEQATALVAEVKSLMDELEQAQVLERAAQLAADNQMQAMQHSAGRRFSVAKFIREISEGHAPTGLEGEVAEMGAKEYERLGLTRNGYVLPSAALRASTGNNASTATEGKELVETMPTRFVDALKERLVIAQLGATVLGDLVGEVPVVSSGSITASWGAEGDEASYSKVAFGKATMKPHRNFVAGAFSKDLLRQTSADVDAIIMGKLLDAQAELIDKAAINGTGADNQPTGLLTHANVATVAGGTNGAAISWANVVALETSINANNANRGKLAYLTNAKVWGALKTTEKAQGTARFLLEGSELNGYKAEYTNLVPSNLTKGTATSKCSAMIFGNFQDLYVGQWGGLDITVDNVTLARKAEVGIIINAWNDVLVAEPKSFAKIVDILA